MQPTESETMAAMYAAARRAYDAQRNELTAADPDADIGTWDETPQAVKNIWLDAVNSLVWAALQALPDRLSPIRQLMHEVDPAEPQDMIDFHRMVKVLLSASEG